MLAKLFDYVLTRGAGYIIKADLVAERGGCGITAVLTYVKTAHGNAAGGFILN